MQMVRLLGTVSLLCGVLIVATRASNTVGRIRHNQETIMRESVARLLPGIQKQIVYGIGAVRRSHHFAGHRKPADPRFFAGYDGSGKFLGVVIEASDRGYADVISAMYSYSPDTKIITGFQVIDMKETPGLGNRICSDPSFLENFKPLDATHPSPR